MLPPMQQSESFVPLQWSWRSKGRDVLDGRTEEHDQKDTVSDALSGNSQSCVTSDAGPKKIAQVLIWLLGCVFERMRKLCGSREPKWRPGTSSHAPLSLCY